MSALAARYPSRSATRSPAWWRRPAPTRQSLQGAGSQYARGMEEDIGANLSFSVDGMFDERWSSIDFPLNPEKVAPLMKRLV